jgi:heterodisulfide reductase subunit B
MKFSYYPGCSLEGTARDYAESIVGICKLLGIILEEIPDWNCCGASAAHSINHQAGIALAARILNQAAKMPHPNMLVPCPMCFNRLKTASSALRGEQRDRYRIFLSNEIPRIWDLADFFATDDMLAGTAEKIKQPLKGLEVVCYYGCMANRPPEITESDNFEDPQSLDRIVTNLGGTVLPWPYKTDCCGASQALSLDKIETKLVEKLFDMVRRVGARGVVVSCQMCQANLDMYWERASKGLRNTSPIPVYYFSELIGLALGLRDVRKWLSRHITDPLPLLQELNLLEPITKIV